MKIVKESINGIPWSGRDVKKAPIIGKIITKEWELQGGFKFSREEYNVVEIIEEDGKSPIYVTNTWYKDYKRIPQLIPAIFVEEFIPIK
jgi:hypothetical protein